MLLIAKNKHTRGMNKSIWSNLSKDYLITEIFFYYKRHCIVIEEYWETQKTKKHKNRHSNPNVELNSANIIFFQTFSQYITILGSYFLQLWEIRLSPPITKVEQETLSTLDVTQYHPSSSSTIKYWNLNLIKPFKSNQCITCIRHT